MTNPFSLYVTTQCLTNFVLLEPLLNSPAPNADQLAQMAQKQILRQTEAGVSERLCFEDEIKQIHAANLSLADEKRAWQTYINFELEKAEPVRARLLYERALVSLDLDL